MAAYSNSTIRHPYKGTVTCLDPEHSRDSKAPLILLEDLVPAARAICWCPRHKEQQAARQYTRHLEHPRHARPHLPLRGRVHGCSRTHTSAAAAAATAAMEAAAGVQGVCWRVLLGGGHSYMAIGLYNWALSTGTSGVSGHQWQTVLLRTLYREGAGMCGCDDLQPQFVCRGLADGHSRVLTVVLHQHPHCTNHRREGHHVRQEQPEPRPVTSSSSSSMMFEGLSDTTQRMQRVQLLTVYEVKIRAHTTCCLNHSDIGSPSVGKAVVKFQLQLQPWLPLPPLPVTCRSLRHQRGHSLASHLCETAAGAAAGQQGRQGVNSGFVV